MRRTKMTMSGAGIALAVLIAVGCGSSTDENAAPAAAPEPATSTAPGGKLRSQTKIPAALAANRAHANEILDEGQLEPKLEELRGHPIVVNQWASWCPPCRAEFPYFQESAETHADDVAFLGIDMQDERAPAEAFLRELPVPYPTIDDPDAAQIGSLGGGVVSPTTVFIDEEGEIVSVFQGVYTSPEQLEADIERHLLS